MSKENMSKKNILDYLQTLVKIWYLLIMNPVSYTHLTLPTIA